MEYYDTLDDNRKYCIRYNHNRRGRHEVRWRSTQEVLFSGTLSECENFISEEERIENGGLQLYF